MNIKLKVSSMKTKLLTNILVKNQSCKKGFASLLGLQTLIVICGLFYVLVLAIGLADLRSNFRKTCFEETHNLEKKVLYDVKQLNDLNTFATALRVSIKATEAAIVAATLSLQFEAIPPLKQQLDILLNTQKALDTTQKALLQKAKLRLQLGHVKIYQQLQRVIQQKSSIWDFLIRTEISFIKTEFPQLAYDKEGEIPNSEVAPNYEWKADLVPHHRLFYDWHLFWKTHSKEQNWVNTHSFFKLTCGAGIQIKKENWSVAIMKDKYSQSSYLLP